MEKKMVKDSTTWITFTEFTGSQIARAVEVYFLMLIVNNRVAHEYEMAKVLPEGFVVGWTTGDSPILSKRGEAALNFIRSTLTKKRASDKDSPMNRIVNDWKREVNPRYISRVIVFRNEEGAYKYQVETPRADGKGSMVSRTYYF